MSSVFPIIIPSGGSGFSEETKEYIQSSKMYQFVSSLIDSFKTFLDQYEINFFDIVVFIFSIVLMVSVIKVFFKIFLYKYE